MPRGYRTRTQQLDLVAHFRASGLSPSLFCQQSGISPVTLRRWLSQNPQPIGFAEVLAPSCPVVVVLPDHTRLEFPPGVPARWAAELLRCLR